MIMSVSTRDCELVKRALGLVATRALSRECNLGGRETGDSDVGCVVIPNARPKLDRCSVESQQCCSCGNYWLKAPGKRTRRKKSRLCIQFSRGREGFLVVGLDLAEQTEPSVTGPSRKHNPLC